MLGLGFKISATIPLNEISVLLSQLQSRAEVFENIQGTTTLLENLQDC